MWLCSTLYDGGMLDVLECGKMDVFGYLGGRGKW